MTVRRQSPNVVYQGDVMVVADPDTGELREARVVDLWPHRMVLWPGRPGSAFTFAPYPGCSMVEAR